MQSSKATNLIGNCNDLRGPVPRQDNARVRGVVSCAGDSARIDAERTYRANQLAYRQALASYMTAVEQMRQAVGTRNLP